MVDVEPIHLFVYGTLKKGGKSPYARLLQMRSKYIGQASIPGQLYNLGAFPGIILDELSGKRVFGEVHRLAKNGLLESLDRYEGCRDRDVKSRLFRRETAWAKLTKGSVFVWVYIFTGRVNGRSLISTGRYELR